MAAPKSPKFRSGFEKSVYEQLVEAGIDPEYEAKRIPFEQPAKQRTYHTDFTFKTSDIIIESKGRWTRADREKILLIKRSNPELDLRLLFQRDNKITRTSKTTYSMWARKHGITCAVGTIPERWIEDIKNGSN